MYTPIEVVENVIRLLQEGRYTATYKQAVLLALVDLCVEAGSTEGRVVAEIPTRSIASKVIALYWPHTVEWTKSTLPNDRSILLQNGSGSDESKRLGGGIIAEIAAFRRQLELETSHGSVSFPQAQRHATFQKLQDSVLFTLIEMPLPKLQRVGGQNPEWLYRIRWRDKDELDPRHKERLVVTDGSINAFLGGKRHADVFGTVVLQSGVAEAFVRLHPLLRSYIEQHWSFRVAHLNGLRDELVSSFLFERERQNLRAVRGPLIKLHDSSCFYCGGGLESAVDVDHFIPWARLPDDGLHNLVPAHHECNANKSDYFASVVHLERWLLRMKQRSEALGTIARDTGWDLNPDRGRGIARSIYNNLSTDMLLWDKVEKFVPLDKARLTAALAG